MQAVPSEAEPLEGAEAHVLDQDVGAGGEFADECLSVGMLEVDDDAFFVAVGGEIVGGDSVDLRRFPAAGVVSLARAFDLPDFGAQVAECHGAGWRCEYAA